MSFLHVDIEQEKSITFVTWQIHYASDHKLITFFIVVLITRCKKMNSLRCFEGKKKPALECGQSNSMYCRVTDKNLRDCNLLIGVEKQACNCSTSHQHKEFKWICLISE